MKVISRHTYYKDIVDWLVENVGPIMHHHAIIYWQGHGWRMEYNSIMDRKPPNDIDHRWKIDIQDEQKAIMCQLRWG